MKPRAITGLGIVSPLGVGRGPSLGHLLFQSLGLFQLLIQLGCLDLRQKLSTLNVGADIEIPLFQIAARPCINRSLAEGLRIAG